MQITGIFEDGRRRDITDDALGQDVAAYLAAARAQGLADDEIEEDLYDALARSPIPADDVRVLADGNVEIEFFDLD